MARREWQDPNLLERTGARGPEWYIRYRVRVLEMKDGKPFVRRVEKWHCVGLQSEMTRRQAEREKTRIMREVNGQVYTMQSHIPFPDFAEIFKQNHLPSLAVPTRNNYTQQLNTHIVPAFKDLKLYQVGPLEVQQFFVALESDGVALTTRNTIRGVLSMLFRCAKKWNFLETENPVHGVSIGRGQKRVRPCRIPELGDVQRLIDACDGDVPLLIETLYTTGMRISEAAGLQVADIDFRWGVVNVQRRRCRGDIAEPKSEDGYRRLPLGHLCGDLAAHCAGKSPADLVFTYNGEPIVDNTLLANYVSPRMKKLGIKFPGFGWHTFRRMHLTMMRGRLSVFDLRRQAGHADIRTTQRYIADELGARQRAVEALPKVVPIRKGA